MRELKRFLSILPSVKVRISAEFSLLASVAHGELMRVSDDKPLGDKAPKICGGNKIKLYHQGFKLSYSQPI